MCRLIFLLYATTHEDERGEQAKETLVIPDVAKRYTEP